MQDLWLAQVDSETVFERPEGWRIRVRQKGWRGLIGRVAWWILHRLRCLDHYEFRVRKFFYGRAERERVSQALTGAFLNVIDRGEDPSDYCAVMGPKELRELALEEYELNANFIALPLPPFYANLRRGQQVYRNEWRGLKIHVVAGLSGMALIPRVIVESPAESR